MIELLGDEHTQKSDPYMEELYGLLDACEVYCFNYDTLPEVSSKYWTAFNSFHSNYTNLCLLKSKAESSVFWIRWYCVSIFRFHLCFFPFSSLPPESTECSSK